MCALGCGDIGSRHLRACAAPAPGDVVDLEVDMIKTYNIQFTPNQGTLMRLLTQVTRRAIDLEEILATKGIVVLTLEVTEKQDGQLRRAWENQIDVHAVS